MKRKSGLWVGVCFGACLLGPLGCSSRLVKHGPDPALLRFTRLDNQLTSQEAEIRRLNQTISSLQEKLAVVKGHATKAAPRVIPLTKLSPEVADMDATKNAEEPDNDDPSDDTDVASAADQMSEANVVADSRFEAMPEYYRGMYLFESKKFDAAEREFERFQKENPQHVYADRAQYWIAACHFENHDYALAVYAMNQLESRYPFSLRIPDAMHKKALALIEMGQSDQAANALRDLLRRYPDAAIAPEASRLLAVVASSRDSGQTFVHEPDAAL